MAWLTFPASVLDMKANHSYQTGSRSTVTIPRCHARTFLWFECQPARTTWSLHTSAVLRPPIRPEVRCYCDRDKSQKQEIVGSSDEEANDLYPPAQTSTIRESWELLMRWSRIRTRRVREKRSGMHKDTRKVLSAYQQTLDLSRVDAWTRQQHIHVSEGGISHLFQPLFYANHIHV